MRKNNNILYKKKTCLFHVHAFGRDYVPCIYLHTGWKLGVCQNVSFHSTLLCVPQCYSLASLTCRLVLACGYQTQHNLPDFQLPEFSHAFLHTTTVYCLSNIQTDKLSGGWILCAKPEVAYESSYDKRAVTPSTSPIPQVTKYRIFNSSQHRNLQCQLAHKSTYKQ